MLVNICFVSRLKKRILKWFNRNTPKHTPNIPPKPSKAKMPRGKNKS